MRRPYSCGVFRLLACGLLAVALCTIGASAAPAAKRADDSVFGGLGTWIDIYDGPVYAAPERSAQHMSTRDVKTVWMETANDGVAVDIVNPIRLGRLVDALHARGIRVVAWYLPGHMKPALDLRRSLAMLAFRSPEGGAFDGVALDIESTKLRNAALRSKRAVTLARQLREPARVERDDRKGRVAGGALKGFDATYGYVTRALRLLRTNTGNPDIPVHVAGGVANRLGPEELAGFVAAVGDDGGMIGVSLYDWMTTPPRAWKALAPLNG